jgi:hypothetical protein
LGTGEQRGRLDGMENKRTPSVLTWVLVLGIGGFLAGFVGPMILQPESNQGPLVGIFITGPLGALLGLVVGLIARFLPITNGTRSAAMWTLCATLVLVTLFYCLPEPERQGALIDGGIAKCESPASLIDAGIADWEKRVAQVTWSQARSGWQVEARRTVETTPGVVLTLDAQRQNLIRKHRKPWNSGRIDTEGWKPATESRRYFVDYNGSDCASYTSPTPLLYERFGQGSNVWPPNDLPGVLDLPTLEIAPVRYARLENEK